MFRVGDKVMQVKNHEDISNGDIGYIKNIVATEDGVKTYVDFGDGRIKEYESDDLDMLDLGYASTVHKSQGSEYPAVVIPLMMQHYVLLQRNLVYTGVTRGKKLVVLVGEARALHMAVKNNRTRVRHTRLTERLRPPEVAPPPRRERKT